MAKAKKYKLVKKIGNLKKGSVLELKGVMYVSGSTSFDAFSVWKNKTYFERVK
jgi:hypothetical protein